jgi:hypothetical protein
VRVHLVLVFEPRIELGHDGGGVGRGIEPDVVALEGLHEGLGDAVGFRAAYRRGARHEADRMGEGERLVRREAAAVVGQPFHRLQRRKGAKPALDREQHQIANGNPADAAGAGGPGKHLAVMGVDGEGDPDRIAFNLSKPRSS